MIYISTIADLMVKIGADVGDFTKNMEKVQGTLSGLGSLEVGKTITNSVSKPIMELGSNAINAAADFEQGMKDIQAVSGATGQEMQNLQSLALQMGKDTAFSAKDAASGIEELVKAGVSMSDIVNGGLSGALSLATAGELDLASAAEIASTALNAFKADGLSVSNAADILAGAANASATSVSELKFGLSAVSAVASSVGMSFKDTTTALAVFAQNGLKGSDAGTSLKTMLMNLQPKTKDQIAAFKELGLVTEDGKSKFFDASGSIKSMADIAGILQGSMAGMTDAQRLATMETMFGSDAIRAANILYKEGTKGIENMQSAMGNVTAAEVAATKMDTFKGSVEQMKGSIETAMISIGSAFLPVLRTLADFLTGATNAFMGLDPSIQTIIVVILALVAAIGPVLMIIGMIQLALPLLAGAFTAATAPIWAIIGAVAALVAIFYVLWNTNETFRNAIIAIWYAIKLAAMTVFGAIRDFFSQWSDEASAIFKTSWDLIKSIFSSVFQIIWSLVTTIFSTIKDFWDTWGSTIIAAFQMYFNILKTVWGTVFQVIFDVVLFIFNEIKAFWDKWGSTIVEAFKNTFEILKIAITTVLNIIMNVVKTIFNAIKSFWDTWGDLITALFKTTFDIVKVVFESVWNNIKNIIELAIGVISNVIKLFLSILKGDWSGAWDAIQGIGKAAWDFIVNGIKNFSDTFSGIFNALKDNILGIFSGIWNGISSIINKIIDGVNSAIAAINKLPAVNIPSIPNIPTSSAPVQQHADGGIFTKPTMWGNHLIGESGDEALIPLNKLNQYAGGGSDRPIIIYLEGQKIYEGVDRYLGSKMVTLGGI